MSGPLKLTSSARDPGLHLHSKMLRGPIQTQGPQWGGVEGGLLMLPESEGSLSWVCLMHRFSSVLMSAVPWQMLLISSWFSSTLGM